MSISEWVFKQIDTFMQWNTTQQKKEEIIDLCNSISESLNHVERNKSNT